jgi:hypothetical protein
MQKKNQPGCRCCGPSPCPSSGCQFGASTYTLSFQYWSNHCQLTSTTVTLNRGTTTGTYCTWSNTATILDFGLTAIYTPGPNIPSGYDARFKYFQWTLTLYRVGSTDYRDIGLTVYTDPLNNGYRYSYTLTFSGALTSCSPLLISGPSTSTYSSANYVNDTWSTIFSAYAVQGTIATCYSNQVYGVYNPSTPQLYTLTPKLLLGSISITS